MTLIVLERPPRPTTPRLKLAHKFRQIKGKVFKMSANVDKPIEVIHRDNLPDTTAEETSSALQSLVEYSSSHSDVAQSIHARMHFVPNIPWMHPLVKGIEKVAANYHVGNYVVIRGKNEKIFESMPIYAR